MNDPIDDMIEKLILLGAMEVAGIDSVTGEFLYSFTPKFAEINPELSKEVNNSIHNSILELWSEGFLEIDMTLDEPMVALTEKCFDKEAINQLDFRQQSFLRSIMERFRAQ